MSDQATPPAPATTSPAPLSPLLRGTLADRRLLGADEWPRGEHAHRSGLLAALFPLASGEA